MSPARRSVNGVLDDLYRRPGFLLRRAHQIAVAIFIDECKGLRLTPPQHGILLAVHRMPGLTQAELSRLLGFDRAMMGQVVDGLVRRKLLRRDRLATNRRLTSLTLSPQGARLLDEAASVMKRTSRRILSPLRARERETFVDLLMRVTSALNDVAATPIEQREKPS
jgi:DNA-binding MarR family transcriptional regulator